MILKRNDKGEFEEVNVAHVTPELLILSKLEHIEEELQANYEARLKADMVAMLEDLDLQIDESAAYNREYAKIQRLIRDKINTLKEQNNEP